MQYIVISKKEIQHLIFAVQTYLDNGWEPVGGMLIETLYNKSYFYQTLVKK